jgi:hypothetical protein
VVKKKSVEKQARTASVLRAGGGCFTQGPAGTAGPAPSAVAPTYVWEHGIVEELEGEYQQLNDAGSHQ